MTGWMAPAIALLLLAIGACGDGRPKSYEDCLIDLGRSRSAQEARSLCRQAFPAREVAPPFYVGAYHYLSTGQQCGEMQFYSSGHVTPGRPGFCGDRSRMECSGGECRFVCLNYAGTDTSAVFRAMQNDIGMMIVATGGTAHQMYRSLAACEQAQQSRRAPVTPLERALMRLDSTLVDSLGPFYRRDWRQAWSEISSIDGLTFSWRLDSLVHRQEAGRYSPHWRDQR
jgi:hypothetical protein